MKNIAHLVYPFSQDLRTCEQLHGNTEDCRTHPVDAGDGEGLGDTYHTILRAVASLRKCYLYVGFSCEKIQYSRRSQLLIDVTSWWFCIRQLQCLCFYILQTYIWYNVKDDSESTGSVQGDQCFTYEKVDRNQQYSLSRSSKYLQSVQMFHATFLQGSSAGSFPAALDPTIPESCRNSWQSPSDLFSQEVLDTALHPSWCSCPSCHCWKSPSSSF